ncbi:MAG TPA: GspE/PulE family protein [Chthonomonadales bacterium]|nr:GspE/PulE family protein [Chthonomonadales bacterium]
MARKSMGDFLIEEGLIAPEQLQQAEGMAKQSRSKLPKVIVELGYATERDVWKALAQSLSLPFVDLNSFAPESGATNIVPDHIARRHNVIPVKKDGANNLWVAMGDADNPYALDDLRVVSRCMVRPVLAGPQAIEDAIARVYGGVDAALAPASQEETAQGVSPGMNPNRGGVGMGDLLAEIKENVAKAGSVGDMSLDDDDEAAAQMAEEAPIIRVANAIIQRCIHERGSDIHLEPERRGVRVRYRVDGVLHEAMLLPKYIQPPLISRFKIMAEMNIAERRLPQDGRIPIRYDGKDYDLRVSCLPSVFGEKIVCRILDKSSILIGLQKLGFSEETQAQLEELVIQPNGMVLSTGPTGHGKTTTQYSILNKLNSIEKNIITIEDPVEYQLGGVTQVQVNRKAGLTFANALRSFLRQDPDIIMVGEMRDLETAEIAIEASLTGHLVLSTLHTNDAPSAVIRMIDMGVEPYLIAATVVGVLAQRLGRRICQHCKEPYEEAGTALRKFGFRPEDPDAKVTLWRGRGCEGCRHTGYSGRLGVFSLMRINDEIAELIVRRAPLTDIRDAAKANGMRDLREDGLLKVLEGITTPDEVMRVVFTAGFSG